MVRMVNQVKNKNMRCIKKQIPIYPGLLALCVTSNAEDLYSEFTKESVDATGILERASIHAHTLVLDCDDEICYTVLLNLDDELYPITPGDIAHEALHVVNLVFDHTKISYSLDEDEHAAYFIKYIVDSIHQQLNMLNLKLN